jgi:hypothetical protein
MARYLQNAAILSGKRSRTATATFVAAPADKLKRESRGIVLPSSRFTKTWWQEHVATLTPAAPEVPDDQAIVTPAQPALNAKAKRAVRTRQEQALETATARRQMPWSSQKWHEIARFARGKPPFVCINLD